MTHRIQPLFLLSVMCACGVAPAPVDVVQEASRAGASPTIPGSFLGLSINDSSVAYPTVPFGVLRFWDTSHCAWPLIEQQKGVYTWTTLDNLLRDAKQNGQVGFYTLSRTPSFYASNPSDPLYGLCNYGPGECEPPTELNADGTGTDQTWIDWVTQIASHAAALDGNTYARIQYWEPWNEVDRSDVIANDKSNPSYQGTYAQLVRMTEDARCVITGKGTIHPKGFSGQNAGGVPCNLPAIDSTAQIVMPSSHAAAPEPLAVAQNFLSCSAAPKSGSFCNGGSAGSKAIDIVNFHMKPGNYISSDTAMETEMTSLVEAIQGISPPASMPLWNGEGGYSGTGDGWGAVTDDHERAGFVARYFLLQWSLGVQGVNWYTWDNMNHLSPSTSLRGRALQQVSAWMVGATLSTACAVVTGTTTRWTCQFTRSSPAGYQAEALWDTSRPCSAGVCATAYVSVDPKYTRYVDLQGNVTSIPTSGTHRNQVPVGIEPILVQN